MFFDRTVAFAMDDDPAVIVERVRGTLEYVGSIASAELWSQLALALSHTGALAALCLPGRRFGSRWRCYGSQAARA